MAHLARDGVRLAHEERGAGERSLVFVHGWTCSHRAFARQAEHSSRAGYRTVSVDLRGHGASDAPEDGYSIATFAEDVAHQIGALGLGRPVAIGHSMGGLTVLQLAAAHPELVSGIVMVDPAPLVFPAETRAAIEGVLKATAAGDPGPRRSFVEDQLFLPSDDPGEKARIVEEMCATPARVAVAAMEAVLSFDGPAAAAACAAPALHIAAEPALNPPALMSGWLKGVVNAQTVGAGHFNQILAPIQVNDMIEQFLRVYVGWS